MANSTIVDEPSRMEIRRRIIEAATHDTPQARSAVRQMLDEYEEQIAKEEVRTNSPGLFGRVFHWLVCDCAGRKG